MLSGLDQNGTWPGPGAATSPGADVAPPASRRGLTHEDSCDATCEARRPPARVGQPQGEPMGRRVKDGGGSEGRPVAGRIGVETSPRAKASPLPPGVGGREPAANRLGGQCRYDSDGNVRRCGPRRSSVTGPVVVPSRLTPRPMGRPRLVRGVVGRRSRLGRATQRRCPMLEPYALKGACTVLRGGGAGDSTSLPDRPTWAPGREPRAVHRVPSACARFGLIPARRAARQNRPGPSLARRAGMGPSSLAGGIARSHARRLARPLRRTARRVRSRPPRDVHSMVQRLSRDCFASQSQWRSSARTSCPVGGYVDPPRPAGVKWRRPAGVGSCGLDRICGHERAGTSLKLTGWRNKLQQGLTWYRKVSGRDDRGGSGRTGDPSPFDSPGDPAGKRRSAGVRLASRCGRNGEGKAFSGPRIGSPAISFQRRACSAVSTARMRSIAGLPASSGARSIARSRIWPKRASSSIARIRSRCSGVSPSASTTSGSRKAAGPSDWRAIWRSRTRCGGRQDRVDLRLVGAGLLQGEPDALGRGRQVGRVAEGLHPAPAGAGGEVGHLRPLALVEPQVVERRRLERAGRARPRRGGPPGRRGSSRPAAWCRAARPAHPGRSGAAR